MDLIVVENLLKEFKNIQMSPTDYLLEILNNQVGVKVYFSSSNSISFKEFVDKQAMAEQGFESFISYKSIYIESLYPLEYRCVYSSEYNLTIVPNNIFIPEPISIAAKKQFLINYFNNIKTNSKSLLTSLTRKKSKIQKEIMEKDKKDIALLNYSSLITTQEFLNKGYNLIKLPIFPTEKVHLFAVKIDKIDALKYAHDVLDLNSEDYISFVTEKEKDRYYFIPNFIASECNLTPLDKDKVLEIFPDIFGIVEAKKDLEQQIINIEKEKTFIQDLKKEENFIKVIDLIENNIN